MRPIGRTVRCIVRCLRRFVISLLPAAALLSPLLSCAAHTKAAPTSSGAPTATRGSSASPSAASASSAPPSAAGAAPEEELKFEENDRLRGEVTMGGLVGLGLLPKPSIGAQLTLGLRWPHFGLAAELRYLQAPESLVGDDASNQRSISTLIGMGAFSACWYHPGFFYLCPVLQVAELGIHPNEDETHIRTSHPLMMAQAVRIGARWQAWPNVYLSAFAEAGFPFVGAVYVVDGKELWGSAGVNGILGIRFGGIIGRPIKDAVFGP